MQDLTLALPLWLGHGWRYNRYFGRYSRGPWLTRAEFSTGQAAFDGLALPETGTKPRCKQRVTVETPVLALKGHVRLRDGSTGPMQWFAFNINHLTYGDCQRLG
jgi:hypothetical protein